MINVELSLSVLTTLVKPPFYVSHKDLNFNHFLTLIDRLHLGEVEPTVPSKFTIFRWVTWSLPKSCQTFSETLCSQFKISKSFHFQEIKHRSPNSIDFALAVGFNVETVSFQNTKLQVWDLGGQTGLRPYWRCYYQDTNAVVYVIDSADRERLDVAR